MRASNRSIGLSCLAILLGCTNADLPVLSEVDSARETLSVEHTASAALAEAPESPSVETEPSEATVESSDEPVYPKDQPSIDDLLLLFPAKHPNGNWNPNDLDYEDVWITSDDGTKIHGWFCSCDNPRAYVLYAHGNAGNLTHRSALLKRLQSEVRVTTLIFDYRGYDRRDGSPTTVGAIADMRGASKFLARKAGVKESQLVLMGRSLGGASAIQLASDTQPRGLIVESTFPSLKQVATHHYPNLAWLVPRDKLNSRAAIGSYKGPLLYSHGTHDQTIPYELGVDLFDEANDPKRFIAIEDADHNDSMPNFNYDALSEFIDDLPRQRN